MSSPVLAITERPSPSSSCIPAASFAPPVPPARTHCPGHFQGFSSGRPVILIPACVLYRLLMPINSAVSGSTILAWLEGARVDRAQPVDQLDHLGDPRLVRLAVAADQHVLVEFPVAGQRRAR